MRDEAFATWKVGMEPGRTTVEVNGEDITGHVKRLAVLLDAGTPTIPSLQLEVIGSGHLEGRGIVKVLPDEIVDEAGARHAVIGFLDGVNPTELERRIAAGPMAGGVGMAVISILKQMVTG